MSDIAPMTAATSASNSTAEPMRLPRLGDADQRDAEQQEAQRGRGRHPSRWKGGLRRSHDIAYENLIDSEALPREVLDQRQGTKQCHESSEREPQGAPFCAPP